MYRALWLLWHRGKRRKWLELKYGLIRHTCECDYENRVPDEYKYHYKCRHYGCNFVTIREKDGSWILKMKHDTTSQIRDNIGTA